MINEQMASWGSNRSVIRELFEYGKQRAAQVGAENVFDYSIGNPTVPAPAVVNDTIIKLASQTDSVALHGYTSAQGDAAVREGLAQYITRTHGFAVSAQHFYLTCGAAAGLAVTLHALVSSPDDEIIAIAPFFPEYRVFTQAAGAKLVTVPADIPDFQINFAALEKAVTPHTRAVIVNSPNNPGGTVYSRQTLQTLAALLEKKQREYGEAIYIIADEPYRELVYDDIEVPFIPSLYANTVVCYSYSKSLSLPGERIGWLLVPPCAQQSQKLYAAVAGAGRALGYVCAPSLFQRVVLASLGQTADVSRYKQNRDLLCSSLEQIGYTCAKPAGAFYVFMRSPEPNANAFSERAKQYDLLLVPGDSFACEGYVRLAYCVSEDMIRRSLPAFRSLYQSYQK